MHEKVRNTRNFNYISAVCAFLIWGSWSFYVNYSLAGLSKGLISGIAQGISSFIITLFMTYLIEWQFNYYQNKWAKFFLPPICTVLLTGSSLILVHYLVETPHIFKTVSPALSIAILFAFFTNYKLSKQITH